MNVGSLFVLARNFFLKSTLTGTLKHGRMQHKQKHHSAASQTLTPHHTLSWTKAVHLSNQTCTWGSTLRMKLGRKWTGGELHWIAVAMLQSSCIVWSDDVSQNFINKILKYKETLFVQSCQACQTCSDSHGLTLGEVILDVKQVCTN